MGCAMQVQPARINTKSAPSSTATSLVVTEFYGGGIVQGDEPPSAIFRCFPHSIKPVDNLPLIHPAIGGCSDMDIDRNLYGSPDSWTNLTIFFLEDN